MTKISLDFKSQKTKNIELFSQETDNFARTRDEIPDPTVKKSVWILYLATLIYEIRGVGRRRFTGKLSTIFIQIHSLIGARYV